MITKENLKYRIAMREARDAQLEQCLRKARQENYGPLRIILENTLEKINEWGGLFLFVVIMAVAGGPDPSGPSDFPD